jgi:hypothetical protein
VNKDTLLLGPLYDSIVGRGQVGALETVGITIGVTVITVLIII